MNNSKLPPSVELDGPRLDEVKARTLADYRPQHDYDCAGLRCATCGEVSCPLTHRPPLYRGDHPFVGQPCSCGLDTLLSAALEHGRSSETVEQATRFVLERMSGFGSDNSAAIDRSYVNVLIAAVRAEEQEQHRESIIAVEGDGIAADDVLDGYSYSAECVRQKLAKVRAESPSLGGERSPQSEAVEQPVSTDVRLVKEYDRLLVAVAHVSGLSASAVNAELQGEFDRFAAAVRQAERSSEPAGLTTGTEAK